MANTMYPAMANSPKTELSAAITATDTTIKVVDATKLPKAPNILTILSGDTSETISYAAVSGNDLTGCVRGLNGTAKAWSPGMKVSRTYTAYDHDTFLQNINEIIGKMVDASIIKKGLVQLSSATTSDDVTKAATPAAIKSVKDAVDTATKTITENKTYLDEKFVKVEGTSRLELGVLNSTVAVPSYVDFHSGAVYSDFDSRIISSGGNGFTGGGNLSFQANTIDFILSSGSVSVSTLMNIIVGSGNPEGVVNGSPGRLYLNTAGGAGTTLYIKESGSGNQGWKSK